MARFLTKRSIVGRLDEIIKQSEKELFLISPYIKADEEIKYLLSKKKPDTAIHVIFGKEKLKPDVEALFNELRISPRFLKNLHAKCYMNENEALVTSMNLYDYSLKNNDEMGILISKAEDDGLYNDVYDQVTSWWETAVESGPAKGGEPSSSAKVSRRRRKQDSAKKPTEGFCIRCKTGLTANPEKPYCQSCFKSWNKYKNEAYEEKHCHICGKAHDTTLLKPLCSSCFRKYKNVLKFAIS